MASVRIWQKRQIVISHLNFAQSQMLKIGIVGVAAVKNRLGSGLDPDDSRAKPLTKRYAIWKTKRGRGNRRDLTYTGSMLANFQVRTVAENKARAGLSTRKDRIKAWMNQKIQPWIVFSPKNKAAVVEAARRVFQEATKRLAIERSLGGKQQ